MARMPARASEEIAEAALDQALQERCRGGSWRGLARGLAWRLVADGERSPQSIDLLAETAEAILAALIDDGLWSVEQVVLRSWSEFLEACPGDEAGALQASRLDASEESAQVVASACEHVLAALLASSKRAA